MRPITDRAEIAIDFPEKAYMGSFGRMSAFDARAEVDGIEIKLAHTGAPKRSVEMHLHWYLFADIVDEIAASIEGRAGLVDETHRAVLVSAVQRLDRALVPASGATPPKEASAT
jgi:hypothetical protein